jgi:hypothetical protein
MIWGPIAMIATHCPANNDIVNHLIIIHRFGWLIDMRIWSLFFLYSSLLVYPSALFLSVILSSFFPSFFRDQFHYVAQAASKSWSSFLSPQVLRLQVWCHQAQLFFLPSLSPTTPFISLSLSLPPPHTHYFYLNLSSFCKCKNCTSS